LEAIEAGLDHLVSDGQHSTWEQRSGCGSLTLRDRNLTPARTDLLQDQMDDLPLLAFSSPPRGGNAPGSRKLDTAGLRGPMGTHESVRSMQSLSMCILAPRGSECYSNLLVCREPYKDHTQCLIPCCSDSSNSGGHC
jgi:hypothetical protein